MMNLSISSIGSEADLRQYREQGYASVRGAVPGTLLELCQSVLERWVDAMASKWLAEGRIRDLRTDLNFRERFNRLWLDAGKPSYQRSPRKALVELAPREVYEILTHPALADLAEAFLGTSEIVSHGVWNSRPKTPDAKFTDTPWHQDAQYFRDQAHLHIMTVWFPLHDVAEDCSCLAVSPSLHTGKLYDNYEWEENGFIGLSREEAAQLPCVPVPMRAGEALCFPQLTPHRALPNRTNLMRWSMDLRFMAADQATPAALKLGLMVRSADSSRVTRYEEWLAKWEHAPW